MSNFKLFEILKCFLHENLLNDMKKWEQNLKDDIDTLKGEINTLKVEINRQKGEINTLNNEINRQKIELKQLRNQIYPPQVKYNPVSPEHEEFGDYKIYPEASSSSTKTPDGNFRIIGAKVRGKNHKKDGIPCDDWFECSTIGNWTIVAVADGAGSKKQSRIGAKTACKTAIEFLKQKLISDSLSINKIIEAQSNKTIDTNELSPILDELKKLLSDAIEESSNAIKNKSNDLQVDQQDLSTTIMLVILTTIPELLQPEGEMLKNYNLVCTCNIGDGMIAAINEQFMVENKNKLLLNPDRGDSAGQTRFIPSTPSVHAKQNNVIGQLRTLMIMTDGVSEDYDESEDGFLTLYGDLVLNGIISHIDQTLETNPDLTVEVNLNKNEFQKSQSRVLPKNTSEIEQITISYMEKYSKVVNKPIKEILKSKDLLALARISAHTSNPQEQLKIWLDSYHVNGSGDDRTLVVIYQE